ncbi:MAG TPA: fumarylacetoacetase [Vicinamibacterales bacterium]|jgi:fumarylacetoacetase
MTTSEHPIVDETHDPSLESWVESANDPACDFPIQNLPLGAFARRHGDPTPHIGIAIGDQAFDLRAAADAGVLGHLPPATVEAVGAWTLNGLMSLGRRALRELRRSSSRLLRADAPGRAGLAPYLVPLQDVELLLPANVGDYTDFYASVFHATNVGSMFRPDNPLLPNYKFVPIGYHGRASSIVTSGTIVKRPRGQIRADGADAPSFGPSARLDYELEVGLFVGPGNGMGIPIPMDEAEDHAFGLCLVNDWSARDIQQWEYQPLGPFLAKSFATSLSPWVITLDALAPFRVPAFTRPEGDPAPLAYLDSAGNRGAGGLDVTLEVLLSSQRMRASACPPIRLSLSSLATMYWTFGQMVAHHTSNGCNLRPGDLLASGTVSGPTEDSLGSLLELTWRGTKPITLPTGEARRFLEDGDEVIVRGWCAREGFRRIGFGECRGIVTA